MEITITNLAKKYKENIVLDIANLTIQSGEIIGLVGNNGAGKTTLMRLILDLIAATNGTVTSGGKRVDEDMEWKKYTGSFLDGSFLIDFYTPEEYFAFIAELYGISSTEMNTRLSEHEVLMNGEIMGQKKMLHEFSMGNRQKIGIIGAMITNPKVLILDEPFNFIDPTSQIIVAEKISKMNEEMGTTVIVSSHSLSSINDISTRILLLEKGKVIMDKHHTPGYTDIELETYFKNSIN